LLPQAATFGTGVGALGASLGASLAPFFSAAGFFSSPDDFSSLDLAGPHDPEVALSVACDQMK